MINTYRRYSPTPIDKRSLRKDGDVLECRSYEIICRHFPKYEQLWKLLIWDITDRDFTPSIGQPREDCPENLRKFAEAHYTFLRSFMYIFLSKKYESLETLLNITGQSIPFEHEFNFVYINERVLNIYTHFGRIRDMVYLMLECFEKEINPSASFRMRNKEFDTTKILEHLINIKNGKSSLRNRFNSWVEEIYNYRNLVHKIAHAIIWRKDKGEYSEYILRPNKIKNFVDWIETLRANRTDLVLVEEIINKHFKQMTDILCEIWDYFIGIIKSWRISKVEFRKRLGLPNA